MPAQVVELRRGGWDDKALGGVMRDPLVAKVGVDAPFGWPVAFSRAVREWSEAGRWPFSAEDRRGSGPLTHRETDRAVTRVTKEMAAYYGSGPGPKHPLSVSADKIGVVAMRCAALLAGNGCDGPVAPFDRTGRGLFVEVYPDLGLRAWSLLEPGATATGYKASRPGAANRRAAIVDRLAERLEGILTRDEPWVDACKASDDTLDALLAALIARCQQLRLCHEPDPEQLAVAEKEGWIAVPMRGTLEKLHVPTE